MTDLPDTGDGVLDLLIFSSVSAVGMGIALLGMHGWMEMFRRKYDPKELEI